MLSLIGYSSVAMCAYMTASDETDIGIMNFELANVHLFN
jgi:hypothetical protein